MSNNTPKQANKKNAKDLLLADYKYLCDSFWKNETTGETRTRFFITLVTAVLAALAMLVKTENTGACNNLSGMAKFVIIFSLCALFAIGLVTLFRIVKRNEVTDGYKKDMDEIRERFKFHFAPSDVLKGYFPHRGSSVYAPRLRKIRLQNRSFLLVF